MSDRTFDRAVTDWLESGSDRTPPPAIDAVLLAVKTTPQERDLRIPRRFTHMPFSMRLAVAVAIVAIVGVAGFALIKPTQDNGVTPSPTPTSAPVTTPVPTALPPSVAPSDPPPAAESTNLDKATWLAFTSDRYGYSAAYPARWYVAVATEDWLFMTREQFWSSSGEGADRFVSDGSVFHLTVFSSTLPAQTTAEAWIAAYERTGPECPFARDLPAIDIDGHPGRISTKCDMAAFVTVGQTMFVFSIDDYNDVMLRTFLTTVKLPAA
jgi:hypothetical protein